MANERANEVRCEAPRGWTETPARRAAPEPLGRRLTEGGRLDLLRTLRLAPRPGAPDGAARVVLPARRGEDFLVVLRQPSGALSIHRPAAGAPRRGAAEVVFELPLRRPPGRRGPAGDAVVLVPCTQPSGKP